MLKLYTKIETKKCKIYNCLHGEGRNPETGDEKRRRRMKKKETMENRGEKTKKLLESRGERTKKKKREVPKQNNLAFVTCAYTWV